MVSALTFLVVFLVPLLLFFLISGMVTKERRGIAAGIPKPKTAKPPRKPRPARVRQYRVDDCGRGFTHLALSLVGSRESCRYCRFEPPGLAIVPDPPDQTGADDEPASEEAAVPPDGPPPA